MDEAENLINGRFRLVYVDKDFYALFIKKLTEIYKRKSLVELRTLLSENKELIQKDYLINN